MEIVFIFLILFLLFFITGDHFLLFIAMQEDSLLIFYHLISVFSIRIIDVEWYLREILKYIELFFRIVWMIWINRVR